MSPWATFRIDIQQKQALVCSETLKKRPFVKLCMWAAWIVWSAKRHHANVACSQLVGLKFITEESEG